jgi:hypothetical protein
MGDMSAIEPSGKNKQKLITEAELQTHLEDGWKCLGVLSGGRIVIERDTAMALGFTDTIRRIIEHSEIQAYLNEGWHLATVQIALVLPSGK